MLKVGNINLKHGMPRIALSFSDNNKAEDLKYYQSSGLDLAEIRVDLFKNQETCDTITEIKKIADAGLTTLLTIRSRQEGGEWCRTESERLDLLMSLIKYVDSVDIELSTLQNNQTQQQASMVCEAVKKINKTLIISHHDFKNTPPGDELEKIIMTATAFQADVVKMACQVNSYSDISVLTDLLIRDNGKSNIIAIGMGVLGMLSRVSFFAYGSLLTFGRARGMSTAPGQLLFEDLLQALKLYYPAYCEEKKWAVGDSNARPID